MKKYKVDGFEPSIDSDILLRGLDYYKNNKIIDIWSQDNFVKAYIHGEEIYKVEIKAEDGIIEYATCTCPFFKDEGEYCKHITAVLFHLKNNEVPELEQKK